LKVVWEEADIADAFDSATREAVAAFGRGECFVEKYLDKPRHVETQCLADREGNVVVVSTRDCSLQRRHQKLVEEAPAPFLTDSQRDQLYSASKAILKEAKYEGAGTCEFLIARDGTISFLEVNTRLQVEHPVSEEVTGIDLVREQFRIAEGGLVDYPDPEPHGHSIEFRINGEDPGMNFMPMPGPVHTLRFPGGPGIRVDSGVTTGDVITGAFDSLLAKLIVTGHTREDALERARRALWEFEIAGLPTVLPFHRLVVDEPAFAATTAEDFTVHTRWIETEFDKTVEPWSGSLGPESEADDPYRTVVVEVEGRRLRVGVPAGIFQAGQTAHHGKPPKRATLGSAASSSSGDTITSPMQATLVKVAVTPGDSVVKGDLVCVLEAMKMEQPITAHRDGVIADVTCAVGDTVSSGHILLTLEPEAQG
jgi:acetyl-CoA/propionyl-CoA carboxylase biotin carboxyl carrier protein